MNSLSFTRAKRGMFYNEPSNFRNRKCLSLQINSSLIWGMGGRGGASKRGEGGLCRWQNMTGISWPRRYIKPKYNNFSKNGNNLFKYTSIIPWDRQWHIVHVHQQRTFYMCISSFTLYIYISSCTMYMYISSFTLFILNT